MKLTMITRVFVTGLAAGYLACSGLYAADGALSVGMSSAQISQQTTMNTFFSNMATEAGLVNTAVGLLGAFALPSSISAPTLAALGGTIGTTASMFPVVIGTSSMPVLSDGATLKGFITVGSYGFQVNTGSSVTLALTEPVNSTIYYDGTTGTNKITLGANLFLTKNASFSHIRGVPGTLQLAGAGYAIYMDGDQTLPNNTTLKLVTNDLIIDGGGHSWTMTDSSSIIDLNARTLTLRNMVLNGFSGATQLIDSAGSGTLKLQNCLINLSSSTWTLDNIAGTDVFTVRIRDDVDVCGTTGGTLAIGGNVTDLNYVFMIIEANSCLTLNSNTTLYYNVLSGDRTRISLADFDTSVLRFHNATLSAPGSGTNRGIYLYGGKVIFDGKTNLTNASGSSTSNSIGFGSTLTMRIVPGSHLLVPSGLVSYGVSS